MRVLLLTKYDNSLGPMACAYLLSFNQTIEVHSAGLEPADRVSDEAITAMGEVGINISWYLPINMAVFLEEEWDYVITLCDTVNEEWPSFVGKVRNRFNLLFSDPLLAAVNPDLVADEFRAIRGELHQALRKLNREKLIDEASCPCGANFFCRCE